MKIEHFSIYSNNCLRCSALVDGATTKFAKCHFEKGNTECPASQVRIVATGKPKRLARQVIKARNSQNIVEESRLLQEVSKESKTFQSVFYMALTNKGNGGELA